MGATGVEMLAVNMNVKARERNGELASKSAPGAEPDGRFGLSDSVRD